jgi:hypothetical protein
MTRRGARLLPSSSWSAGYAGSHGHEDHHQQVVALRGHAEEQDDLALLQSEEALAVALHDFKAAEGDELSIREGEELLVLHRYRDGWCVAQNESSEIGLVPLNHLEVEEEHPTGLAGGGQQQTFRSPAMIPEEEAEKIDAETTASAHEAPDDGAEARLVLQSQMAEYLSNFAIMKKKASSQPPSPQLVTPSAESTAVSPSFPELIAIFSALDKNNDGRITHAEFITGLKRHPWIAEKLGIPANIHQEDGTRDTYQLFFGKLDTNDSKSIEFGELCRFFGFQPDHLCAHIGVKTDRGQFLSPPQNDCTSFNEEMGAAGSLEDQKCGMPRVQEWVVVSAAPSQTSYLHNTHADADMSLLDEDVSCPHSLPVGLDLNDQALEPDSRLCHEQHSTSHLTESSARASHGIPRGNRLEESQPAPELAVHIPSAAHIAQPPNEPAQLSNSRAFHGEVQELNSPRMTGLQEADARDGLWSFCSGIIPVLREVDTVAAGLSRERADAKIKPPPLGGRYLTEEEKEDMDRVLPPHFIGDNVYLAISLGFYTPQLQVQHPLDHVR